MTHKDIYIKFMIEYDKANVTSSYPSLTEYEVATVLDKAYNALIAQKLTGNNVRRVPFEGDLKSIADLQPLISSSERELEYKDNINIATCTIPRYTELDEADEMLYFVSARLLNKYINSDNPFTRPGYDTMNIGDKYPNAQDGFSNRPIPVKLVNHDIAEDFVISESNMPWVKTPICFIEDKVLSVVYDPINKPLCNKLLLTYIKQPNFFAKDLSQFQNTTSYFDGEGGQVKFELNDTMAEELISLAISFALENIESPRLNTKLNMRGLES